MELCDYDGRPHVISRIRGSIVELVDSEGVMVRVPITTSLGNRRVVAIDFYDDLVPLENRPSEWLKELRTRRLVSMAKRIKSKRTKKEKPEGVTTTKSPRKSKLGKIKDQIAMASAALPPEFAAAFASLTQRRKS